MHLNLSTCYHLLNTLAGLKPHLQSIRQQGFSLDAEEFMPEVHCLGAPIFDARDSITASMAISGPVSRAAGNGPALVIKVKQVAAAASRALKILGYANPATPVEAAQ